MLCRLNSGRWDLGLSALKIKNVKFLGVEKSFVGASSDIYFFFTWRV